MLKKKDIQYYHTSLILFLLLPTCLISQSLAPEQIYKKVSETVVVIHSYNNNGELAKQGSGVVINDSGFIVTNYHVFEGCARLELLHNNDIIPVDSIIGLDSEKDILILKIKEKILPTINLGNSEALVVGEKIYAIGSPFGLENTISEGIISGLRNIEGNNLIQVTASISQGSSGGAIVNKNGELIGISTSTLTNGQNLNFAIPINDILSIELDSESYSKYNLYFNGLFSKVYEAARTGKFTEAFSYYANYTEKNPSDANGYICKGTILYLLENYVEAYFSYTIAIEIDPYQANYYFARGSVCNNLSLNNDAIQDYTKAIEINPNYAEAYYNRALSEYELGNNYGAIQDYTRAIEINPTHFQAYLERGSAKGGLKDYRGAIKDFTTAIELNAYDEDGYIRRGAAKYALGDKNGACLDWSKAGELGSEKAYEVIQQLCQ